MLTRLALFCALAGAFFTLSLSPTLALSGADQDRAIAALQSAVASLQSTVRSQQATINTQASTIGALQTQNTSLQNQVNALKSITSGFSRITDTTRTDGKKGTELFLTGFNLHVVNGLGATNGGPKHSGTTQTNGLGNVIIGYNATIGSGFDTRTGSHDLVLGDYENYSSFGGLVCGVDNTIAGPYASISGGDANIASGDRCSIIGGYGCKASGLYASVFGGESNTASGDASRRQWWTWEYGQWFLFEHQWRLCRYSQQLWSQHQRWVCKHGNWHVCKHQWRRIRAGE